MKSAIKRLVMKWCDWIFLFFMKRVITHFWPDTLTTLFLFKRHSLYLTRHQWIDVRYSLNLGVKAFIMVLWGIYSTMLTLTGQKTYQKNVCALCIQYLQWLTSLKPLNLDPPGQQIRPWIETRAVTYPNRGSADRWLTTHSHAESRVAVRGRCNWFIIPSETATTQLSNSQQDARSLAVGLSRKPTNGRGRLAETGETYPWPLLAKLKVQLLFGIPV